MNICDEIDIFIKFYFTKKEYSKRYLFSEKYSFEYSIVI